MSIFCYSNTLWPQIRGGQLGGNASETGNGTHCVPEGDVVLFFGADDGIVGTIDTILVTRMAVTKSLDLQVPGELIVYGHIIRWENVICFLACRFVNIHIYS